MDEWVWSNGGMLLTGENWSTGRKTLYSLGDRWMNEYGAMVEWYWQVKTEVLGEKKKHYTMWVANRWMCMEQRWSDTDSENLQYRPMMTQLTRPTLPPLQKPQHKSGASLISRYIFLQCSDHCHHFQVSSRRHKHSSTPHRSATSSRGPLHANDRSLCALHSDTVWLALPSQPSRFRTLIAPVCLILWPGTVPVITNLTLRRLMSYIYIYIWSIHSWWF